MRRRRIGARARRDLKEIWRYTGETWGIEQADRYNHSLNDVFDRLASFPEIGRDRPDIGAGVRVFRAERHVVLYRIELNGIVVLRVVHQSMSLAGIELT